MKYTHKRRGTKPRKKEPRKKEPLNAKAGMVFSNIRMCWNPRCNYAFSPKATVCVNCGCTAEGMLGKPIEKAKPEVPKDCNPIYEHEVRALYTRKVKFDIELMGAPRMTQSDRWKKRPVVVRYHAFKDEFRRQCAEKKWELGAALIGHIYIKMPDSWSLKKKAAMLGSLHQQKIDADNAVKGIMDSFNADDSHVAIIDVAKVWAEESSLVLMAPELP